MTAVLGALVGWLLCIPLAWGADYTPGARDQEVVATLQAIAQALPLRTTTLADIAPECVFPKGGDLTWDQALAEAGRRFGQRQPERALFLRPYVPPNASDTDLDQIGLAARKRERGRQWRPTIQPVVGVARAETAHPAAENSHAP